MANANSSFGVSPASVHRGGYASCRSFLTGNDASSCDMKWQMFLRIGSSVKRIPKEWPEFRIWSDVFSQLIVQTWGRMISMFMGCMHPGFKSGGKKMRNSLLLCSIASDLLTGSFEPSILRIIWKDSEICQNYMSEILKKMKFSWLLSNDKAVYAIFSTWGSPRNHRKMLQDAMACKRWLRKVDARGWLSSSKSLIT